MRGQIKNGILVNGYEPHLGQVELHQDPTRFRICVCGRRWGKTTAALNELYMQAWMNTDKLARCWYVAPNYRQAKTVAWEMIKEVVPEQVIQSTNEAELSLRLVNGSLIELKGADSQDSLRGAKIKFVVMDEYASMRSTAWDEVIRPAMADTPDSRAIFIGTPSGFNHFKVLFDRGESGDPDFKSYRFRTLDNPYVNPTEIEEIKKKTNPTVFRQEYEASFEQMAGSVYPMFRRETHAIKPMPIDENWDRLVGMDWGSRNPSAVIFAAVDPSGNILVYDVWYQAGLTVSQWAEKLKNREDFEKINAWVIDPSALAQAREFGQYGIYFTSYNPETLKKLNDVTIGINLVSQYFLEGKIKIFDHCDILIQQLEQYQWEPSQARFGSDARPKPLKKDDHSCFTAGTKVLTSLGYRNIEDIKQGDMVVTRGGNRMVEMASSTGFNDTKTYLFSDGTVLTATPDHPVFTTSGKVAIDSLSYSDKIAAWITQTSTGRQELRGESILERFQKVVTSITRIITLPIMPWRTLSACHVPNISNIMDVSTSQIQSFSKESDLSLQNGMEQKRVWNGIENTEERFGKTDQESKRYVSYVVNHSEARSQGKKLDSVVRIARWLIEGGLARIEKLVSASYVEKIFNVIGTFLRRLVPSHAPRLIAKTRSKIEQTYNLQVNQTHEFFANGLCVSNCDALRYLVSARPTGHKSPDKKYKGLDGKSEMFWRYHNNDLPKEMDLLMPRDTLSFGLDEEYATYGLDDIW